MICSKTASSSGQCVEVGEDVVADASAGCADDRDPLREKASTDKTQDVRGRLVEPLRIVDDADEGGFVRDVCQQAEHCHADEEPVRWIAPIQAESGGECGRLWRWEVLEPLEKRPTKLVQTRKGELHLRLDTRSADDSAVGSTFGEIVEERRLADSGFSAQDERLAAARLRLQQ
jgi:hypothetical protein